MARDRAEQRSRASTRRPDAGRRSAAAPPATDTSPTPPAVPPAVDRPRRVATDIPAADPRRQPRKLARRPIPWSPDPRTAAAAHPEPAATPNPPQHLTLTGCCDDRLNAPAPLGTAAACSLEGRCLWDTPQLDRRAGHP